MDAAPPVPPPRSPLRPPPPTSSEPVLSKRQHALHELLSSERAYASDLALILKVHIPLGVCAACRPFPALISLPYSTAQGPMTAEDIKIIFGNIADLAELSDAFCEVLEQTMGSALDNADATDDRIGELFMRFAPELETPYKQYITRHPTALAHLTALPSTPELTAYHTKTREAASSLSHAWDLSSLLIKPVQRLLKYSLLLAAIIDSTALTHPDRPTLITARTAMEEVARAVNEGRRRAEVVKEVLSAPKKPPTVLRLKSFRAPADVNSEAARVDRMAAELARIDVFAQQLSRASQEWARAADTSAHGLLSWARAFAAAIGLTSTIRSEAFDAFLATLSSSILPRSAALLPQIASDILAPLARLLASAAQPRQLLASMAEHAPLHHHLLTMPLSAKNRPPPALMSASAHYLALRVQLAAELPAYLSLLHRGLAALVRRLAAVQAAFFADSRDAWAGLWDMLRVEGERNGGGAETEAVWRQRWGDVDLGMHGKAVQVSNVLATLEPPRRAPVNVANTAAMLGALQPQSPLPQVSGPYPLSPGRPRRGSDTTSVFGGSVMGFTGWNSNDRGKSPVRPATSNGKPKTTRNRSPTPSAQTAKTARDGQAEFGEFVSELGWGDYGGMILPPKKAKDMAREEEKAREKERERQRKLEREESKEREKARKREEKKGKKSGHNSAAASADPSPRNSLASSRLALLESAGYGSFEPRKSSSKPKSKSKSQDEPEGKNVARRASDITNRTSNSYSNSNSNPSRAPSRPPSRGHSDFSARRSTWLAAPAQYTCRVVHGCKPPAAVSYFGFPFFLLEEHALLGVLHEAGHPSTHPRLPLYVDDGEDCLLLCRDAMGEIGWALASFLAPLAAD
ncbi:hypothetical protein B0H15DRAFT_771497 [Mycena belliarum]|uniref:DH domain-containing protein n=1 Tax=Mycena belliarum TaxID=1033014 RepID=A0AAD6XVP3_9AGAR|nr:hypothetical protein B0H15DRAFT_771497 [Mycena belliae]